MNEFQIRVEKEWNNRAKFWSQRSRTMWETGSRKDIIPFFSKHVPKHASVLDVGCGDGYGAYKLNERGYNITGIDISEEMIKECEKHKGETEITFLKRDLCSLDNSFQESFDAILAINVFEWTPSPLSSLHTCRQILRDKGKLCIGILGPTAGPRLNSFERLYNREALCHTIMPWELSKLAKENGWIEIANYGVYKDAVKDNNLEGLPLQLHQALSFMWVFMFEKN
ncbi:class I SAM-dependent methyltransferase [Bacillus sp. HMF5848]|uniref:class I SAM-dependent methyltransferase n=1 Tax=Bacillus sp. HMF5848 TaxID=2495421 RepID=UPI000F7838B2|nr:class I SAM-dependent methyltransferase [Bacillus sp. HMF5848]RSK27318.1 class I SAM-dependent methyltransferase [Bacillus sp. HMF5848]